jgi:hypothetical protein
MRPHLNPPLKGEENLILNIEQGDMNKEQSLIPPPLRGRLKGSRSGIHIRDRAL